MTALANQIMPTLVNMSCQSPSGSTEKIFCGPMNKLKSRLVKTSRSAEGMETKEVELGPINCLWRRKSNGGPASSNKPGMSTAWSMKSSKMKHTTESWVATLVRPEVGKYSNFLETSRKQAHQKGACVFHTFAHWNARKRLLRGGRLTSSCIEPSVGSLQALVSALDDSFGKKYCKNQALRKKFCLEACAQGPHSVKN